MDETGDIDFNATLAAAALRQSRNGTASLPLRPDREDLYRKRRHRSCRRLVIFAVDLSDSMGEGPQNRMGAALGAALALVRASYLSRDQVCLVTFRDTEARIAVPPTTSITLLRQRLKRLAVGGATPLADGLRKSLQVSRQARLKHSGIDPLLVMISDGEATSAITPGGDPVREALDAARELRREQIPAIIIDTSTGLKAPGIMPRMAEILGTGCHRLHALTAGEVLELIDRAALETEE